MLVMLLLFVCLYESKSAKILAMFPTASISHQAVYQPIWQELSLRGHQVTVFTPNPLNNSSLINLTEVDMSSTYEIWREDYVGERMDKDRYKLHARWWFLNKLEEITEEYLKKAQKMFQHSETDFDLIIVETLQPLLYSLGCKFKAPFVGVSSLGVLLQTHDVVGNPTHPIIGLEMNLNVLGEFGLYEKIASLVYNWLYRLLYYGYLLPKADKISRTYWGDNCPYLGDLERNVNLILVNTNPILHPVRPYVPNIIEMGQMHFKVERPLPQDLQDHLDECTKGVVYFSLGTNVRSVNLKPSVKKIITEVLSELPYNVLWKYEDDHFPDKPKNVMVRKWFPQQDVLRHRNVKVFVMQGGLQSMEEAIRNTVPMVGIPFIADQPLNVMKMVKSGIGMSINHVTMTKDELKAAIMDAAENKKYKEKMKEMGSLFLDQQCTGLEKTIWWIEYILRQKGAKHLKSPAADISWFKYYFVVLVLLLLVFICIYIVFYYANIIVKTAKNNNKVQVK